MDICYFALCVFERYSLCFRKFLNRVLYLSKEYHRVFLGKLMRSNQTFLDVLSPDDLSNHKFSVLNGDRYSVADRLQLFIITANYNTDLVEDLCGRSSS